MSYIISGGTGFVGRHLARRLAASGAPVHVVARPGSDISPLPETVRVHRVSDGDELPDLFHRIRPRVAFHLATYYAHDTATDAIPKLFGTNVTFASQFANAAALSGCGALINTGTASQLDTNGDYIPASLYAASKQAFEDILHYYHYRRELPCATLLIFDTYGHNDPRSKLLMHMLAAAREDRAIDLSPGGQEIDLVHIEDAIDGLLACAHSLEARPSEPARYALSSGCALTIRALGELIGEVHGRPFLANWGARPYRDHEVMRTWKSGTPPPGWKPHRKLEDFLRETLAL